MSIIFGIQEESGVTVTKPQLLTLSFATDRWALDGIFLHVEGSVGMGCQPFHTTDRSRIGEPLVSDDRGNQLAMDGRLDNAQDLAVLLGVNVRERSDASIVLEAFSRWGESCFALLIGDWAIALWSAEHRILYLGRDHAGSRTLYYKEKRGRVVFSTYLETLLKDDDQTEISEIYAARYLAGRPCGSSTPFRHIHSVPHGGYMTISVKETQARRHWDWTRRSPIVYSNDGDYDEHFRSLLRQAVQRRTVTGASILAQLSGGMDSSSIVCISDQIQRDRFGDRADLVDTVSFFDRSEPDWNEEPFFGIVESQRGKAGRHIEIGPNDRTLQPSLVAYSFPGADSGALRREQAFEQVVKGNNYRVLLSGIGGDELLGGVPTPLPELTELLEARQFLGLFRRSVLWSLPQRTPIWITASRLCMNYWEARRLTSTKRTHLPWGTPALDHLCLDVSDVPTISGGGRELSVSDFHKEQLWRSTIETLPSHHPPWLTRYEYRYPLLDRDLVEFLLRIPAAQLRQPGRRRLLMRRALRGIVPDGILERRRKARIVRGIPTLLHQRREQIDGLIAGLSPIVDSMVSRKRLSDAFHGMLAGDQLEHGPSFLRVMNFELWLIANANISAYAPAV